MRKLLIVAAFALCLPAPAQADYNCGYQRGWALIRVGDPRALRLVHRVAAATDAQARHRGSPS
jgi:hypothetical protein